MNSLNFVNVYHWDKSISNMDLKKLTFWFDESDISYYDEQKRIPNTVTKISTNSVLEANAFHINLINLHVYVRSIVHLLEIIEQTPNIQRLAVTFAYHLDKGYCLENFQSDRLERMTTNFLPLSNLTHLSFSTMDANNRKSNERFRFNQFVVFIDRCCSTNMILKRIALKLDHVTFHKDMWSIIIRYRNTFDRFDFYASLIVEESISKSIENLSMNDDFHYHVEGSNSSRAEDCFIHIYSLPFALNKLHGFSSCSQLASRSSFSTVRYLYFTQTCTDHLISLELLSKHMPYLISINFNPTFTHKYNETVSKIPIGEDIFDHACFLHFRLHCWNENCICYNLFQQLICRMPYLRSLTTTVDILIPEHRQRKRSNRLDVQECGFESLNIIAKHAPHLSTLSLDDMMTCITNFSHIVGSLFIAFSSLRSVSFHVHRRCSQDRTSYGEIAEKTLALVQNMNSRLHSVNLDFGYGMITFYLQNS